MGTNSQYSTTKYMVVARFEVEGVVEKPDVIGAIFGQTEGLFGPELDLRELQKSGRIGRIEIQLDSKQDKTFGTITIPSSLDKSSTAIIAAAIQSVDRIGPCLAKVILEKVADIREDKRRQILDKAKDILRTWVVEESPSTDEMVKQVSGVIRSSDVVAYGPDRLPAGPDVANSPSVILVEGRADIILLLTVWHKECAGNRRNQDPSNNHRHLQDEGNNCFSRWRSRWRLNSERTDAGSPCGLPDQSATR